MTTTRLADEPILGVAAAVPSVPAESRRLLQRATVREILMGAQDNLTTVLAVMLGVSVGTGRADIVALAGLSASVAEAVSMGGVLYSSTRAEAVLVAHLAGTTGAKPSPRVGLAPAASGIVTFAAAMLAGLDSAVAVPVRPAAMGRARSPWWPRPSPCSPSARSSGGSADRPRGVTGSAC